MTAWVILDKDGRVTGGAEYPPEREKDIPEGAFALYPGATLSQFVGLRLTASGWTDDPLPGMEPEAHKDVAAARLDTAKAVALEDFVAWLDAQAETVMGRAPAAERLTYDAKEAAAQRIAAGEATDADLSFIAIEAALCGEEMAVTVAKILTNAALFRVAGPLISGLRRNTARRIQEAETADTIEAVVSAAQARFAGVLADPLAFAADPAGWLAAH